ncbi:MAG: hypothetical protein ACP5PV_12865 [Methanothrix sp.]
MKGEAYASDASTDLELDYDLVCRIMDDLEKEGKMEGRLMKGYEVGNSIHGHRIIAEARKISDPLVIVKTARHNAQRIVLTENALAAIDRKGRWCAQE